mgnify:CR=1 FL=1
MKESLTRKQVKKTNKGWLIWVLPKKIQATDEVRIVKFLQEQKSKDTQYKTKSDLNEWKKFCESLKDSTAIENIPANQLDLLLSKFFISIH